MAHSAKDRAFMKKFAEKLATAKKKAVEVDGLTVDGFAKSLGVTRAGLHKYEKEKSVPGLGVLQRAREEYGIEVKYGELDVPVLKKARRKLGQEELQILLPFTIEAVEKGIPSAPRIERKSNGVVISFEIKFGT
jgi:transcriptional regulator with XRE-family HTH domain